MCAVPLSNWGLVRRYAQRVAAGQETACEELIQTCQRFLDDLDDSRWDFRPEEAERTVQFIEANFCHVKGELRGQPLVLETWQKFIAYNLAGFYLRGTDVRRFTEAMIFVPRKNGKTTFCAALIYTLALDYVAYTSTITIVANRLDRALESFDFIRKNYQWQGEDEDPNSRIIYNNNEHSISKSLVDEDDVEFGNFRVEALASNEEKADGINSNMIYLDEVHAYKNATQYHVYRQAMKAYRHKLLLASTTAGKNMNSFGYTRMKYCQKILEGTVSAPHYFVFLTKADDQNDYTNPAEHEKANPNYGVTVMPEDLEGEALEAQNDPASRAEFLNKSLNIYTNTVNSYFNMQLVIDSDKQYNWTLEELAKLPIRWTGGADLSKQHDLTAGALHGEYNGVEIIIPHGFIPITRAQQKADEDDIPFFWWEEQGWLTMCNSKVIDVEEVVKWFCAMRKMGFQIIQIGFDRQYSREFVRRMKAMNFKMMDSSQLYWKKSEAFRYEERHIIDGKFYYLHNRAYEYCIGNVKAVEDAEERVKYSKVDDNQRIDLFDAGTMACKEHIILTDKDSATSSWFG